MQLPAADLSAAVNGSWYFIAGCGGDLQDWVSGYNDILDKEGIGTPKAWYVTTGREINKFAGEVHNPYPDDLVCLLFPLDGLDTGKLAMFKLRMEDRWFDDVYMNLLPLDEEA